MFGHLVLGCLRDGTSRHGYDVCSEIRARSGLPVNPGNVYRELSKLATQGLIEGARNPDDADPRRNPYRITDAGRNAFDAWLRSSTTQEEELTAWLAFIDRLPGEELVVLLDRLRERLWIKSKALAQTREDALAGAVRNGDPARHDVAGIRSLFQLKQVTAVLEFVEELRGTLPDSLRRRSADEGARRPKR